MGDFGHGGGKDAPELLNVPWFFPDSNKREDKK